MYKFHSIEEEFKLYVFEFSGKNTNNDFNLFKKDFDKLLNNKEFFVSIFNLLNLQSFDISFFFKKSNYIFSKKEEVKKYLKASSIVISKDYIKLIELGLFFKKPITPNYLTTNLENGIQYLLEFHKNS